MTLQPKFSPPSHENADTHANASGRTPGRRGDGPALLRDVAGVVRSVEVTTVLGSLVGAEIGLYIRAERGRVVGEYMKQRGASHATQPRRRLDNSASSRW